MPLLTSLRAILSPPPEPSLGELTRRGKARLDELRRAAVAMRLTGHQRTIYPHVHEGLPRRVDKIALTSGLPKRSVSVALRNLRDKGLVRAVEIGRVGCVKHVGWERL